MKVGILTTFDSWSETYSLTNIVSTQLKLLKKNGYDPVLFVNTNFNDTCPVECEVRKIVPVFTYENYEDISAVPQDIIQKIKDALTENMKDVDVCFTHDIVLQSSFIPHNLALRQVKLPISWYHWIHSQPDGIKITNLVDGHKLVFLNHTDRLRVAERYNTWIDNVEIVYNSVLPHTYTTHKYSEIASKIFEGKEVKIAYAFCTTRMGAKGVNKLLKLAGRIKANGKSVGICLMNSNGNAKREREAIESMCLYATECGLDSGDFVFTSTLTDEFKHGVPNFVTRDMFELSNLFIFPTISECCSMVLLEAMSGGNLLVLNEDIPSMKEFGGFDSALYMKFGSIFQRTNYSDENRYYNDWSKIIVRMLGSSMVDKSKARDFSPETIWETQLKHLI